MIMTITLATKNATTMTLVTSQTMRHHGTKADDDGNNKSNDDKNNNITTGDGFERQQQKMY